MYTLAGVDFFVSKEGGQYYDVWGHTLNIFAGQYIQFNTINAMISILIR